MVISIIFYISLFLLSFLITIILGNNSFSPLRNLVSDMGRKAYSPAPYIFDMTCFLSGLFSIPFTFYILKFIKYQFKTNPRIKDKSHNPSLSFIIANIGMIGIGIFSMDRNYLYLHFFFATFALVGYVFAALYISILILFFKFGLSRIIGIIGFFGVIILLSFTFYANVIFTSLRTISEWLIVLFISIWLYSFTISIFFKKLYL
ncbi:MAG: DUF998 domain-containing protein [Candidatus Lokiarchaeota archaeon]|nr:DUF998 domain-containing protein [Candidatus Lokiarchaeota archaeon]